MLRIQNLILPGQDILNLDFTLLGAIVKESPIYEKGRKVKSQYTFDGEVVVEKLFSDVFVDGKLSAISMTLNWFNMDKDNQGDDVIGLTKTQTVVKFRLTDALTELKKRRSKQIDYLIANAVGTPIEALVIGLFKRYKVEIDTYIQNGGTSFVDVLNNEATEPYLTQLNTIVEAPSVAYPSGRTTKEVILDQIT